MVQSSSVRLGHLFKDGRRLVVHSLYACTDLCVLLSARLVIRQSHVARPHRRQNDQPLRAATATAVVAMQDLQVFLVSPCRFFVGVASGGHFAGASDMKDPIRHLRRMGSHVRFSHDMGHREHFQNELGDSVAKSATQFWDTEGEV